MKKLQWMCAALAAAVCSGLTSQALASSHSEAPGTASDPDIDNADTWAWVDGSNLVVVATYNGLQPPFAAPNWKKFADNALYEIHLSRGDSLDAAVTYRFEFTSNPYAVGDPGAQDIDDVGGGKEFFGQLSGGGAFQQTYTLTRIEGNDVTVLIEDVPVAPPNVGPSTNANAYMIPGGTTYEEHFVDTGGPAEGNVLRDITGGEHGQVFAGPRDDAFYVDLGGIFDLARIRSVPGFGSTPRNSTDFTNVMAIALEINIDTAKGSPVGTGGNDDTVGVWASASRRKVRILRTDGTEDNFGPWRQVSRLGLPLINEAVIGLQDKDYWNRLTPADDLTYFAGYILNPSIVRDANLLGYYGTALAPCLGGAFPTVEDNAFNRMDIVGVINIFNNPTVGAHDFATIGDVLRVDLALTTGGFPNGRELLPGTVADPDVVDIELTMLLCPAQLALGNLAVSDGVDDAAAMEASNKNVFPYLPEPWEGFEASPYATPDAN